MNAPDERPKRPQPQPNNTEFSGDAVSGDQHPDEQATGNIEVTDNEAEVLARPATPPSVAGSPDVADESAENGHPLGPLIVRGRCRHWSDRIPSIVIFAACGMVLGLAVYLTPDPSGVGTHAQLGWPFTPCSAMEVWGIPCPTCGMTTAFAHAVRFQWLRAFLVQPAGFLTALVTIVVWIVSGATVVTGRKWGVNWYRVRPGWTVLWTVVIVLVAWGYKIWITLHPR